MDRRAVWFVVAQCFVGSVLAGVLAAHWPRLYALESLSVVLFAWGIYAWSLLILMPRPEGKGTKE